MAKIRHRTFEIFEFLQEASQALASKSAREPTYSLDPDLWRFRQLDTVIRSSGVVHVTFKRNANDESKSTIDHVTDLAGDLVDLAEQLPNGSRVLLDFEGVQTFNPDAVAKLTEFKSKLQHKGSRVVLCNLEPTVQASFFPHLGTNTNPSS